MKTPVAFVVFNRPECTALTLAAIRKAQPSKLFVIADGPRPGKEGEAEACAAVRDLIDRGVDWPCKIERNYSETNLGCAERVAGGLTWAFSRSERLVVIEDDCLPDKSFFPFCDELLERYATDTRVGSICGCTRYSSEIERPTSYIFSRYGPIWGWASWRRAWDYYSLKMESWPRFRDSGGLASIVQSQAEADLRKSLYDDLFSKPPGTWDYQWGYAKMSQGLLNAIPCRNLIENIGFASGGTHFAAGSQFGLERMSLDGGPLRHPEFILPDAAFDRSYSQRFTSQSSPPLWRKLARQVKSAVKKMNPAPARRLLAAGRTSAKPMRGSVIDRQAATASTKTLLP